jgi:radical SAM protein with 4Fe4S-binding SPASM domain
MHRVYSAPTVIDLEVTDVCNEKCRHCLNFDRDASMGSATLSKDQLDQIIDEVLEAGVFHVILSGGESFVNFEVLEYGIKRLSDANISTSVCSNLSIKANRVDRIKRLRDAGLDHILTSLISHDPVTCDYMVNAVGAFERIVSGIDDCVSNGIRVSANMVVMQRNKDHVFETAKLAHELGCQKIFGTRMVAPNYDGIDFENLDEGHDLHVLAKSEVLDCLDQLVRARDETGIMVGTLVSYPLCLLGDMEKYADFVGRGCPTQRGHRMSILPGGDLLACAHINELRYGNIFEGGLRSSYAEQHDWHNGSYHNPECAPCDYRFVCESGCRVDAHAYTGKMNGRDPLMVGPIQNGVINKDPQNSFVPFRLSQDPDLIQRIGENVPLKVSKRLRFRREDGFHLMSIRWANIIEVENEIAEFLQKYQRSGESFTADAFGRDRLNLLADYFLKDVVEAEDRQLNSIREKNITHVGLSIDPNLLPENQGMDRALPAAE